MNELNNFFSNVGSELASKIGESNINLTYEHQPNIPLLDLVHTTPQKVAILLKNISDSKATGEDGIPIKYLKMTIDITLVIICHIINISIDTGQVPSSWKTAVITPLFKDGDRPVV